MDVIQVVMDKALLRAVDRAARRVGINRSALIREALREHLRRLSEQELEVRDREGYRRHPVTSHNVSRWERAAVWPKE